MLLLLPLVKAKKKIKNCRTPESKRYAIYRKNSYENKSNVEGNNGNNWIIL